MSGDHEKVGDGILAWVTKEEPVVSAFAGAAVVGWVGDFLATHNIDAGGLTQYAEPSVTAAVLLALGFLVRTVVKPAAHWADEVQDKLDPPAVPPTTPTA